MALKWISEGQWFHKINFLSSTLLFTAAMWWPLGSIATCCIEALGSGIIGSDWSFCNNQLMSPASDNSKVWPVNSKCELLQTGPLRPSPAGWGGGRRRLLVRWLGRFAKGRKVEVSFSIHSRVHLAGEISHFEIPYSGCAILSSCEHPPSFCLFIRNGKFTSLSQYLAAPEIQLSSRFC